MKRSSRILVPSEIHLLPVPSGMHLLLSCFSLSPVSVFVHLGLFFSGEAEQ